MSYNHRLVYNNTVKLGMVTGLCVSFLTSESTVVKRLYDAAPDTHKLTVDASVVINSEYVPVREMNLLIDLYNAASDKFIADVYFNIGETPHTTILINDEVEKVVNHYSVDEELVTDNPQLLLCHNMSLLSCGKKWTCTAEDGSPTDVALKLLGARPDYTNAYVKDFITEAVKSMPYLHLLTEELKVDSDECVIFL